MSAYNRRASNDTVMQSVRQPKNLPEMNGAQSVFGLTVLEWLTVEGPNKAPLDRHPEAPAVFLGEEVCGTSEKETNKD